VAGHRLLDCAGACAEATAWFWHVKLENTSSVAQELDLTYAQDLALASYGAVRLNEFYVSQYVDHTPLSHAERGTLIASRQNQAVDGRYPWSLIGSLRNGVSFATDAMQLHGFASRNGDAPVGITADLPGRRLQHEHSMAVLRDARLQLAANGSATAGFFGSVVLDIRRRRRRAISIACVKSSRCRKPRRQRSRGLRSFRLERVDAVQLRAGARRGRSRSDRTARALSDTLASRGA